MEERTLVILKPDGVEKRLEATVANELTDLGLRINRRRKAVLKREVVAEHYAHHADKPFFPGLCNYMTRGPVVIMEVEGPEAVARVRELVGVTSPAKAAPHTLRARFGRCLPNGAVENVVHASEKPEEAEVEIRRFFGADESWWRALWRRIASWLGLTRLLSR